MTMKKIISLSMIVLFSVMSYSTQALADDDGFPKGRVAATGDEPNGDGQDILETNQAGVTVLGAGTAQTPVCKDCQTSGKLLLSSKTRRASPGIQQDIGAGGTGGTTGGTTADPVGTGN
jgi:hypothetical protein